jgi:hypothetical protein
VAFRIRTIDLTATGGEIVRERVVDKARLTIGRAAENDIHLPDLAVEQHHARIDLKSDGTLAVVALGTLGFGLDGRSLTQGVIDPRTGGEIALGSARLTVTREADGTIAITIRQLAPGAGPADALRSFSLISVLPSKRAMSWILASTILLLLLLVPATSFMLRAPVKPDPEGKTKGQVVLDAAWSSGALSLKHQSLEDNCESCHVRAFESVQDKTCLACHKDIGQHARAGRLAAGMAPLSPGEALLWKIAQSFGKEGPLGCVSCHSEHEGKVRQQPASEAFCASCHRDLASRLTDTELANAHDFGTAHPQFRPVYFASFRASQPVRAAVGSTPLEKSGLKFPHDVHLDPRGGAARMAVSLAQYGKPLDCADCHKPKPDGISFEKVEMEQACEGCHSLVSGQTASGFTKLRHSDVKLLAQDLAQIASLAHASPAEPRKRPGQFARSMAYAADFGPPVRAYVGLFNALAPGGICTECHIPTRTAGQPDLMPVNLPDRFLSGGFFSHAAHKREKCSDCHAAKQSKAASDLLIPDLKSCRECHRGASATKTRTIVPSSCAMCHAYHVPAGQWSPEGPKPHYRPAPPLAQTRVAAITERARK